MFKFKCLVCGKEFDKLTAENKCPFCQSDQISANLPNVENEANPKPDSAAENIFVHLIVKALKNLSDFYLSDKFIVHSFLVYLALSILMYKVFHIEKLYALGITLLFIIMRKKG